MQPGVASASAFNASVTVSYPPPPTITDDPGDVDDAEDEE
jgi:hypothetical protein